MKRVILSAGGTGGHLFPAQAVAQSLNDCEVLFVAGGLSQNRFFDRSQYAFKEIRSATFSFSKPMQLARGSWHILRGIQQSHRIIRSFSPDVVVGFGSFYTLPLLLAAKLHNVPIILHEQNAVPGKVNRLLSRFAKTTAITFPDSAAHFSGSTHQVHFPLRQHESEDPWNYFGLEKGKPTLLVFGGSQGAARLNALFLEALPHLTDYQVLHFTVKDAEPLYQKWGIPHCVKAFEPKLHLAMQIADLAITRAGAGTLAELIEAETPAILIPFPYATDNHQEKNARHFVGGEVYLEKDLTSEKLAQIIRQFPIEQKRHEIQEAKQHPLLSLPDLIRNLMH